MTTQMTGRFFTKASVLLLCICTCGASSAPGESSSRGWSVDSVKCAGKRRGKTLPLAVAIPPVVQTLARGSILKCLADLTGGLPLEVWKSSVVLENIKSRERLSPRMVEGLFSGGVLLVAKEGLHTMLSDYASPMLTKSIGMTIPPSVIGFVSGAGGGCAQSLVMGPTSLVVTACVAVLKENGGESPSAFHVASRVVQERGIRGLYRGSPAVAMRQATNWASRQGAWGELIAGCIGGTLSAWNTPFEVARIESQSGTMAENCDDGGKSLAATLHDIVEDRGVGALYVGLIPRAAQACYQTLFLVCVPRLL
ncbi:hypothetical protein ACHAWF_011607 [Thalassiosira exigua]